MGSLVNDAGVTVFEGEIIGAGFTGWTTDTSAPANVDSQGGRLALSHNARLTVSSLVGGGPALARSVVVTPGSAAFDTSNDGGSTFTLDANASHLLEVSVSGPAVAVISTGGLPLLSSASYPYLPEVARPVLDPATATPADIANALILLGIAKAP